MLGREFVGIQTRITHTLRILFWQSEMSMKCTTLYFRTLNIILQKKIILHQLLGHQYLEATLLTINILPLPTVHEGLDGGSVIHYSLKI